MMIIFIIERNISYMKTIKLLSILLVLFVVLSTPIYADEISVADKLAENDMCGIDCIEHAHNSEEAEVTNAINENDSSYTPLTQSEKKIKTVYGFMTQAEIDAYIADYISEAEAKKEAQRLAAEEKLLKARGFTNISVIVVNGVKVMLADYNSANLALIQDASRKAAILQVLESAEQKSSNSCTHPTWMTFWVSDTHPHEYDVMCTNCSEIKLGGLALPGVIQTQITGASHIYGSGHVALETCTYSSCTYSSPKNAYYTNGSCKSCCYELYGHDFISGPEYTTQHPHYQYFTCILCGEERVDNVTHGGVYPGCDECVCQHESLGPPVVSSDHSTNHEITKECNSCGEDIFEGEQGCYYGCSQCTDSDHNFQNSGDACATHNPSPPGHAQSRECTKCGEQKTKYVLDTTCCSCGYHNFTLESECSLYDCGGDGHTVYPKCSECGVLDSSPSPNKHERSDCPSCHVHDYSECISDLNFAVMHNTANGYHEATRTCKSTGTCSCVEQCAYTGTTTDYKSPECAMCLFSETTEVVFIRNVQAAPVNASEPAGAMNYGYIQAVTQNSNTLLQLSNIWREQGEEVDGEIQYFSYESVLNDSFKFDIIPHAEGYINIKLHNQNLYVSENGGIVSLVASNSGNSTKWKLTETSLGYYRIIDFDEDFVLEGIVTSAYLGCDYFSSVIQDDNFCRDEWMICKVNDNDANIAEDFGINSEEQKKGAWCWITAAIMASQRVLDSPITQESAVIYLKLDNGTYNGIVIEDDRSIIVTDEQENLVSEEGGNILEIQQALNYLVGGNFFYAQANKVYSEAVLMSILDAGYPVIAGMMPMGYVVPDIGVYNQQIGHAVVIVKYRNNYESDEIEFKIFDPADGEERWVSYSELRNNFSPNIEGGDNSGVLYGWESTISFVMDNGAHTNMISCNISQTYIQQNTGEDENYTTVTESNEEDLTDTTEELQILQGEIII